MSQLTSKLLVRGTENEKKLRKGQIGEEDVDTIENPSQKAITNINIGGENKIEQ